MQDHTSFQPNQKWKTKNTYSELSIEHRILLLLYTKPRLRLLPVSALVIPLGVGLSRWQLLVVRRVRWQPRGRLLVISGRRLWESGLLSDGWRQLRMRRIRLLISQTLVLLAYLVPICRRQLRLWHAGGALQRNVGGNAVVQYAIDVLKIWGVFVMLKIKTEEFITSSKLKTLDFKLFRLLYKKK